MATILSKTVLNDLDYSNRPNHLKSNLQNVWISNVLVIKWLDFRSPLTPNFLPSSGISSCVRTVDTMMCLHTWHRPACVALGWALIQGFVNWVPLPRMRPPVDRDGVTA